MQSTNHNEEGEIKMSIFGYSQEPSYSNLVGKKVRINRGGPDSVEGTLYAVESNYLVVLAKDGIVYIKTIHVKSITVGLGSGGRTTGSSTSGRTSGRSQGTTRPIIIEYNFNGVLNKLKHQKVQINRGGPEKIEGLLVDVTSDTVLIIVKNELVRVLLSHIKSLTLPWRNSGKKDNSNSKQNNNASQSSGKNKNSNSNASAGNAGTGGNRNRRTSGNTTAGNTATGGNRNRRRTTGNTTAGNTGTGGNRNRGRTTGNTSTGAGRRSTGNSCNNAKRNRCAGTMSARKSNMSSAWDPFPKQ